MDGELTHGGALVRHYMVIAGLTVRSTGHRIPSMQRNMDATKGFETGKYNTPAQGVGSHGSKSSLSILRRRINEISFAWWSHVWMSSRSTVAGYCSGKEVNLT